MILFNLTRKSIIDCHSEVDHSKEVAKLNRSIDSKCHTLSHLFYECQTNEHDNFLEKCVYSFDSDDINTLTSRNNQLDNLLKQDKTGLISSMESATKENEVLYILKGVLDEVGFNWPIKKGLPSPPTKQPEVDNSSQKPSEEKPAEKTESKIRKFFLPVTGVVSVIGTFIFLFWNKLFGTQPISPNSTNSLKDTKPLINLEKILPSSAKT